MKETGLVTLLVARPVAVGDGVDPSCAGELSRQLVEHGGEPVEQGGDTVMAAFPSATDALAAAVALQHVAQRSGAERPIGVALHAGAAGGRGDSEFGPAIVRHLCQRAAEGQVLCTNVVVGLLGGRHRFGLTDMGELELDGVPFPVLAFEIHYDIQPGIRRTERIPMVGREAELRRLRGWWAEAHKGQGGLAFVAGEPGIGKTRLVEELAERTEREGAAVLWGHCYERDGMPYAALGEAMQALVLATPADELRDDLGGGGPALAQLVPALRAAIPGLAEAVPLQPDEERARLLDALSQFLIARSARVPLLLCIDDLQWADSGSIMMLTHLGRFAPAHRILILGLYRPAEVGGGSTLGRLLDTVRDEPQGRRLFLEGLATSGVARLLEALADQDIPDEEVAAIASETQGNPFFIREVIRHLVEEGKVYRRADGRWVWAEPINLGIREGVREVIGRRLSRLSDAANRLLSAASAFEAAFQFDVVAAVAALPEAEARDALDQVQAARLLQPAASPGASRFSHDLVRHAVYEEIEASARVQLHRQAAVILEQTYGSLPSPLEASQIAAQYHQSAALPGAERGVGPALAAAAHAEAAGGFDEAAAFLRIALDVLPPGDERRPRLLGRLGLALTWALRFDEGVPMALEAGDAIAAAEGSQAAAEYLADAAYVGTMAGGVVASWELARRGLEYAGAGGPLVAFAQRGLTDAGPRDIAWARMLAFDCQRREAADTRYPGIPVDSPERRESARILRAARLDPLGPSPMEAVFDNRDEVLTSANLMVLIIYGGEYTACLPPFEEEAREAEALGRLARAARAYAGMAICQSTLGLLPEADASLQRAQALSTRIGVALFPVIYAQDCIAGALGERWEQVAATVGPLLAARNPALAWGEGSLLALSARADAHLGHDEDALESLGLCLSWLEQSPAWGLNFVFLACHVAETLWVLQRTDHAELVERALRAKVIDPDFRCGMVDGRLALGRLCAVAGRYDEALQWWGEARRVLKSQHAATLLAIVDHDEALMAVRRMRPGDAAAARPQLEAARRQFDALGMTGWARRATEREAGLR